MSRIILVTGGARSGKSRIAEGIASGFGEPLGYVATSLAGDGEMAERIARHRSRRGSQWQTMEEPLRLKEVILGHDGYFKAMLVDCITLWLSNLLLAHNDSGRVLDEVRDLAAAMPALVTPLILVTNEVGEGIVPENVLARAFRDLAGEANQILATAADEVHMAVCGLPLKLKG
ncbi:bifunctional adenosylcobinamide kinase/adenosylcobinamide-phosphate guanylyltransferase [Geotalea sp. SG265]|uniref:bifunctional adenosylcobinamide kinase/adenosylcobinamide-phosphate guanylyltransferase n=1 Tax=Geotalea sp. SG265 TaxID=2922867 RepID=UPI001FAFBD7F|nr:bifunctional adenosylcobinamide kinase/adenosylcobinamide-phosphate guanylyltransferase [Geotalea sp. SG265]